VHRVVAELLGVPWAKCEIAWGNTGKNLHDLPVRWQPDDPCHDASCPCGGHGRKKKLQEIAAKDLGGKPKIMISPVNASFGRAEAPVCHWHAPRSARFSWGACTTATNCQGYKQIYSGVSHRSIWSRIAGVAVIITRTTATHSPS